MRVVIELVTCQTCGGTGESLYYMGEPCPACSGRGEQWPMEVMNATARVMNDAMNGLVMKFLNALAALAEEPDDV